MNSKHELTYLKNYQAPEFSIETVDLEFNIQNSFTLVTSRLFIKRISGNNPLVLDGIELELITASMDSRVLQPDEYQLSPQHIIIYDVPDQCILELTSRIYPEKNTQLQGLYQSGDQYCTQCEAEGFRRITWFLDRPDVMSVYRTRIVAEKKRFPIILSNGNLVEEDEDNSGLHWAVWEDPFKKPCYLFAMVAGTFDVLEEVFHTKSGRDVQLQIYVEHGDLNKCQHAMAALKKAMHWDEENYQREYDLGLYMIVSVRNFNAGAMENKGLNIFNSQYILAEPNIATDDDYLNIESVVAHEYFHNWTGNRITCRDWFQLSLKEGLTIFREQSFTEDTFSQAVTRIRTVTSLRSRQFPEDNGPLAHPVQPQSYMDISNFYSTTIYNKGAEIVRMLQTLLGDEVFAAGMQWYFNQYDGQAVTIEAFIHAFETVSGQDFLQFRLWYTQAGTPRVTVTDRYEKKKQRYTLTFKQETPATIGQPDKLPLVIPIATALFYPDGVQVPLIVEGVSQGNSMVLALTKSSQSFSFEQVSTKPIPSLLRHFSAPVTLTYPYTLTQLTVLAEHDSDSFNRWEAGQIHAHYVLKKLIADVKKKRQLSVPKAFIDSFNSILKNILHSKVDDKYFAAEMLTLPSENLLAEKMRVADFQAIHSAREFLLQTLAEHTQKNLLKIYQQNNLIKSAELDFSLEARACRRLKNLCLNYLLILPDPAYIQLAQTQFSKALEYNMTDTLGALRCLVNVNSTIQQLALAAFYEKWKQAPQVVDKWLAQQALSKLPDTLERIKAVMLTPVFHLTNPNQVYALIGTFTQQNAVQFHDRKGLGYRFLRDAVLQLNLQNPILAAVIVKPLLEWKRCNAHQQKLMRREIAVILEQENLSRTLYEVVQASV